MRVAVVTPIPTPYRDPFWDVLGRSDQIQLGVIYCSEGRSDRPWCDSSRNVSYQRVFPRTRNLLATGGWGASCYWTPHIGSLLAEQQPEIVLLGGYNHLTMLSAASWCRRHGVPFLLMCETWRQRAGLKSRLKRRWLRRWLKHAAGALPTGSLAEEYLISLGIPRDRQFRLPNVPDIEALQVMKSDAVIDQSCRRSQLGVDPKSKVVLFAARMVQKKRPDIVLEAFSKLDASLSAELVLLGDGPQLPTVKQLAEQSVVADRIHFKGFVAPDEVHQWMCVADVFVQPSSETWGVAPIEALACGCPVILSRETGCHADVLTGPADGIVLDVVDARRVAEAITRMLSVGGDAADRTASASTWVDQNHYEKLASRLRSFLRTTLERTRCE